LPSAFVATSMFASDLFIEMRVQAPKVVAVVLDCSLYVTYPLPSSTNTCSVPSVFATATGSL
jgi:hypothetical protein